MKPSVAAVSVILPLGFAALMGLPIANDIACRKSFQAVNGLDALDNTRVMATHSGATCHATRTVDGKPVELVWDSDHRALSSAFFSPLP